MNETIFDAHHPSVRQALHAEYPARVDPKDAKMRTAGRNRKPKHTRPETFKQRVKLHDTSEWSLRPCDLCRRAIQRMCGHSKRKWTAS